MMTTANAAPPFKSTAGSFAITPLSIVRRISHGRVIDRHAPTTPSPIESQSSI
jgi:hypothetical protein